MLQRFHSMHCVSKHFHAPYIGPERCYAFSPCFTVDSNKHVINYFLILIPVSTGFLTCLNKSISNIVQSIPSRIPIWDPIPRESSMRKNITDQNGAPGNSTIACVKIMKARPVPSAA